MDDIDKARGNGDWSKRSIQYVVTPNGLLIIYDPNLDAPKERKNGIIKTKRQIPSDPLSPARKNKVSPDVQPLKEPSIIDSNGQTVPANNNKKSK